MSMIHELPLMATLLTTGSPHGAASALARLAPVHPMALLVQAGDYGFWSPIIAELRAIGIAASGVGLVIAILIKGAAATNGERHALAARVAQNTFAGLFLILLGWFIYERMVAWTPL